MNFKLIELFLNFLPFTLIKLAVILQCTKHTPLVDYGFLATLGLSNLEIIWLKFLFELGIYYLAYCNLKSSYSKLVLGIYFVITALEVINFKVSILVFLSVFLVIVKKPKLGVFSLFLGVLFDPKIFLLTPVIFLFPNPIKAFILAFFIPVSIRVLSSDLNLLYFFSEVVRNIIFVEPKIELFNDFSDQQLLLKVAYIILAFNLFLLIFAFRYFIFGISSILYLFFLPFISKIGALELLPLVALLVYPVSKKLDQGGSDFFGLCLLASVKLFFIIWVNPPVVSDSYDYFCFAKSLASEGKYACLYQGDNPNYKGREFYYYRPVGYPFFLAILIYFTGDGWKVYAGLAQGVLEIFCYSLGLISLNNFWSKFLWLIFNLIGSYRTPLIITESLNTSLIFISAILFLGNKDYSGLIFGAACLIRQSSLLAGWFILRNRQIFLYFISFFTLVSLILGFRNYYLCQRFTVGTTNFFRHNVTDFGISPWSSLRFLDNTKCWEFEFNEKLKSRFLNEVDIKKFIKVYFKRLGEWFLKFYDLELLLINRIDSTYVSNTLKIAFFIHSYLMILGVMCVLFSLVTKKALSLDLSLSILFFLLLHPLVSGSNIRFLSPVGYLSFFLLVQIINQGLGSGAPKLGSR